VSLLVIGTPSAWSLGNARLLVAWESDKSKTGLRAPTPAVKQDGWQGGPTTPDELTARARLQGIVVETFGKPTVGTS
jgi:hypothetical protein